jgi:hypothetical protein
VADRVLRYYRIAGIGYRISLPAGWEHPQDYMLAPFRSEPFQPDRTVDFSVVEELTPPSGAALHKVNYLSCYRDGDKDIFYEGTGNPYIRVQRQGSHTDAQVLRAAVPYYITVNLVITAMDLAPELIRRGGFLLHASYIRHGDGAILFTAPSGTGKSTQAALWERFRGAELINGDRAGVVWEQDGLYAQGVPYSGSSGVSKNIRLPIVCIVSLSQAPKTTIAPLTGVRAFRRIWEGCTVNLWDRQAVSRCTDLVSRVAREVPVFHLACTPDLSAVEALEQAIENMR